MGNENLKQVTEEEKKDNERFQELNKISETERTEEQKKELGDLKERHSERVQKRIDQITREKREAEEEAEKLRLENEELRKATHKKEDVIAESTKEETVEIGGKKYFTDKALLAQIKSGEIAEDEAYLYQRKRDKEEIKADLRREHEEEERRKTDTELRTEDKKNVLKDYPHFSKTHPDFNPEDPVYKLSNELYAEGYAANPKGLSLAIKRAKEILRISDTEIDTTGDHEVEGSSPPPRSGGKKEITLSEDEKEAAVRMYTRGDVINPKTQRPYTVNEAIAKGLQAKKERISR